MQADYLVFITGLSFMLLAVTLWREGHRTHYSPVWAMFAMYCALRGLASWVDLPSFPSPSPGLLSHVPMVFAFLALFESGRRVLVALIPKSVKFWWLCIPLAAITAGWTHDIHSAKTALRILIGIPGLALVGWALLKEAKQWDVSPRRLLQLSGLILPLCGLVALASERSIGVMALDVALSSMAAFLFWLALSNYTDGEASRSMPGRWWIPGCLLMLLVAGSLAADHYGRRADEELRGALLAQAKGLAQTINPTDIERLTFTASDAANPVHMRLRDHLATYASTTGLRSIYTQVVRDGHILFGPESLAEDDPLASPPGTRYMKPSAQNREIFRTGLAYTEAPYTDEYGTFVSALAPVLDPRTGDVLMVVGLDIDAREWQEAVHRQRAIPIGFTMLLVMILVAGDTVLRRQGAQAAARTYRFWNVEAALTASVGLVLAIATANEAWRSSAHHEREIHAHLAEAKAESLARLCMDVGERQLTSLAAVLAQDEGALSASFAAYNRALEPLSAADAWWWLPADVMNGTRLADVRAVHAVGETSEELRFAEESFQAIRAVLEDAAATGMTTATDVVSFLNAKGMRQGVLVCKAVFAPPHGEEHATDSSMKRHVLGFVGARICIENLLTQTFEKGRLSPIRADLYSLSKDGPVRRLASTWHLLQNSHAASPETTALLRSPSQVLMPVFAFGHTYAIQVRPAIENRLSNPVLSAMIAGLVGMSLTMILAVLVGFLSRRRAVLESEVRLRTAALKASEEAYRRQFAENASVMLLIDPVDLRIVDANQAAVQFYGYDHDHLVSLRISDINTLPPEALRAALSAVSQEGGKCYEVQHRLADGAIKDVSVSLSRIRLDERVILHSIVTDITARKRADEALRHSRERFAHIAEQSREIIWEVDADGYYTYISRACRSLLGYREDEVVGKMHFYDLRPTVDRDGLRRATREALARNDSFTNFHNQLMTKDGRILDVQTNAAPIRDDSGLLLGYRGADRDITEHKRAEDALRWSEARLRAITDSAHDAIMMIAPDGNVTYWNPAAERILGVSADEAMGHRLSELLSPVAPKDEGFDIDASLGRIAGEVVAGETLELDVRRKDGREIAVALSISRVDMADGRHTVGILRDTTEQKRAETLLVETNAQLEAAIARANEMALRAEMANAAKSEFLANMSHEIRTPMNGVIGMTGLLLDTNLTSEQRHFAEIVRTSGEALLSLINDILDFSKIEAQKLELETIDFDLRVTMEDTADLLAVKAHEKALELLCFVEPDVPSRLRGDPGRLRQILVNLGGNAVKFTEQGTVTIRVSLECENDSRVTLRCTVTDTGIGIPADRQDMLFSPFTQVDGSTTRKYGGTGLGLAISKQLAELMGGDIGVESILGQGATFWFTASFERQAGNGDPELPEMARLKDVRVLVVDDHDTSRLLVCTLLAGWGCRPDAVACGSDAVTRLREALLENDPFEVVITDMVMPGMSGLELGRLIKSVPELAATSLIMMTSMGERGDASILKQAGFAGYLTKPLRQSQLRECLRLVLGVSGADASSKSALVTRHTISEARKRRLRILVAEDNATNQIVALRMLDKLGYRADAVANGVEALEALRTLPYDLVLMDCQMPEMDGWETTRAIRCDSSGTMDPKVPIIAMTAHAMKGDREHCLAVGMNDYLSKPVEPAALAAVLERWLGYAGTTDGPDHSDGASSAPRAPHEGDATIFDRSAFLARIMNDVELAAEVFEGFFPDMKEQIRKLEAAIADADFAVVERLAHRIKGAAANVGGEALRERAWAIEQESRARNLVRLKALQPLLAQDLERLNAAVQGWLGVCATERNGASPE